jgi:hypothetical protein
MRQKINSSKNPTQFWEAVKSFRKRPAAYNPIPQSEWKEFYLRVMPTERPKHPIPQGTYDDELDGEILMEELDEAINKTKNGKASGTDGLSAEFYRNLPANMRFNLLRT